MTGQQSPTAAAAHLFEYLRDVQRLRVKPVLTVSEYASSGGMAVDLGSVPSGYGVDTSGLAGPDPSAPVLNVPRVPTSPAPEPPTEVKPWLEGSWRASDDDPRLVSSLSFPDLTTASPSPLDVHEERPADHPEVIDAFDQWRGSWQVWADRERAAKPVRELYQRLFHARETVAVAAQDWELVLGVGRLRWNPADRHVLAQPVRIDLDDATGSLSVMRDDVFAVEQDMLSPEQLPGADATAILGADLGDAYDADLLRDRLTSYVNRIDAAGAFGDQPSDPSAPWMRLAPAVILRKRSRLGLVDALDAIAGHLATADVVPEGLLPLVDPDSAPARAIGAQPDDDGAVHWQDQEYFLPLPVNAEQFEVIRRVDHQPLTLVQGPPGTGKTHTTAALISHLLAQGKRVLVTAQTDQALVEVRQKLPTEIQDLAVSVLGTSQAERSQLTRSVSILAERAHQHSETSSQAQVSQLREELSSVGARRAATRRKLLELRESDVASHTVGPYRGTRAQVADQVNTQRHLHDWTLDLLDDDVTENPLEPHQWQELLAALRDAQFEDRHDDLERVLPDVSSLPTRGQFKAMIDREAAAVDAVAALDAARLDPAYPAWVSCDSDTLTRSDTDITALVTTMATWADRREPWLRECLDAIAEGKTSSWQSRAAAIATGLDDAQRHFDALRDEHAVNPGTLPTADYRVMAQVVLDHVRGGNPIKTDPLGKPKLGLFTSKTLKASAPLFSSATVDGQPPSTETALARLIARADLEQALSALDRAWPATIAPPEDTLRERLAWHRAEHELLVKVLDFATQVDQVRQSNQTLGVPELDWRDSDRVNGLLRALRLVQAERHLAAASEPMRAVEAPLAALDTAHSPSPMSRRLAEALRTRDVDAYEEQLEESARLLSLRERRNRRDHHLGAVSHAAPRLARHLRDTADDPHWDERIDSVEQSWQWRRAIGWIAQTRPENLNRLQLSIRADEDRMRDLVGQIAAQLAWAKSVGRLRQSQIADLVQYTQLVKKLGKGTGKYAGRQQAQIRDVLTRCTDSVPVWIVPLHRVATQFTIIPELFDVVIIDEASQAGLEASFLQFLARRIVVVGDDRQVSPTVIVDNSSVHSLATHHLGDSPYAATWSDPQRSLFDEARAKYPDLVTLVEHRRCVPDIIGFSNEIAYEPDGIRLVPVRESGSSALEPVIPVHVADGYVEGSSTNRRNPAEARAIVDTIKRLIDDPAYDDKTMGVISLLGETQARLIESMLLDEVGPVEIAKRQLRCGVAASFQGSERHVIFLSMVAATDPDHRFAAQTKETAVQRYNVAVSRAQDQLWVFHSESLATLNNPEDLRRRLIEYANRVAHRRGAGIPGASQDLAPEDVLVSPFDSLFEQRVHNRIFERGYVVVPQYEALGYRIDLVVVGHRGKFAIECDGDNWHGPDQYMADLARQRELERTGWTFFRVRQSDFVVDPAGTLAALWPQLDALDAPPAEAPVRNAGSRAAMTPSLPAPVAAPTATFSGEDRSAGSATETSAAPAQAVASAPSPKSPPSRSFFPGGWPGDDTDVQVDTDEANEVGSGQLESELGEWGARIPYADPSPDRSGYDWLAPYETWSASHFLPPVKHASIPDLADSLVEIIATEGPVLGVRVMQSYVRASGGLRLGKSMGARLDQALTRAVREGRIVADNPTRTRNSLYKTYRLPDQATVRLRVRGPRTLYEIPVEEMREGLARLEDQHGVSGTELLRLARVAYGMSRLEDKAVRHLQNVLSLPRPQSVDIG